MSVRKHVLLLFYTLCALRVDEPVWRQPLYCGSQRHPVKREFAGLTRRGMDRAEVNHGETPIASKG